MRKLWIKLINFAYITVPVVILIAVVTTDVVFNYLGAVDGNTIASICATLIGFLIAGFAVLMTMRKPEALKKENQVKTIKTFLFGSFIVSIIAFSVALLFSLIKSISIMIHLAMYAFIWGSISTMFFTYGLVCIGRSNFLK